MCKLEIEQGYNRIELEFKTINQAAEVIEFIKDGTTKPTKFTITDNVEEVKGE